MTDHVHARPFERSVVLKLSAINIRLKNLFERSSGRIAGTLVSTLLWVVVLGLTTALGVYLRIPGIIQLSLMFACLVMHEMGHYFEMTRFGVPVVEVGVGVPFGLFRRIQYRIRLSGLPFRLMLSPLWIAFYVDEGKEGKPILESLGYRERIRIFAAGPTVNLVIFLIMMAGLPGIAALMGDFRLTPISLLMTLGWWISAWLIVRWWFPEGAHLLSPAVGLVVIALLVSTVGVALIANPAVAITNGGALEGGTPAVLGPVTMIKMMARAEDVFGGALGTSMALRIYGFIMILNFGLAATNFLPIRWFDGGQIWGEIFRNRLSKKQTKQEEIDRRVNKWLWWLTGVIFGPLVIVLIFSEVPLVLSWILMAILFLLILAHLVEKRLEAVRECVQTCTTT